MTSTIPLTLDPDTIDDLLYFARTNSLPDLTALLSTTASSLSTTPTAILLATTDPDTGNSALHMASANGHTETISHLLATPSPTPLLNHPNHSGSTPLHYAALNGHLAAVSLLLAAGADPSVVNSAGHDAVYEAEVNGQDAVARLILEKGGGLERGVGGKGGGGGEAVGMGDGEKGDAMVGEGGEVEVEMGGLRLRGGRGEGIS